MRVISMRILVRRKAQGLNFHTHKDSNQTVASELLIENPWIGVISAREWYRYESLCVGKRPQLLHAQGFKSKSLTVASESLIVDFGKMQNFQQKNKQVECKFGPKFREYSEIHSFMNSCFRILLIFPGGMKRWWKILKLLKIMHFQSNILTQWCQMLIWILVRWKVWALRFPTHKNSWPCDELPLL